MRINLLPLEYRPRQQITFLNLMILLGCTLLFLVSVGFGVYEYFNFQSSNRKMASVEQQITFLQSQMAEVEKLELTQAELNKLQGEIEKIKGFYQPQLTIFNCFGTYIPDNVWLEELVIDSQGKVVVTGRSLNIVLIGNFLNSINNSNFYQTTSLKEIKFDNNDVISYQFNLELATGRGSLEYDQKQ